MTARVATGDAGRRGAARSPVRFYLLAETVSLVAVTTLLSAGFVPTISTVSPVLISAQLLPLNVVAALVVA